MPSITNIVILTVTAYCSPCKICCGTTVAKTTSSGVFPTTGRTVAASRSLAFGTRVEIQGHLYVVEDRLAKRFDSRVDVFMGTHKEAVMWGKKRISVKIITKGTK